MEGSKAPVRSKSARDGLFPFSFPFPRSARHHARHARRRGAKRVADPRTVPPRAATGASDADELRPMQPPPESMLPTSTPGAPAARIEQASVARARESAVASDGVLNAEHLSPDTHCDVLMPHPHERVSCTLAGTERVLRKRVAPVTYAEASEGSTDSESEGAKAIAPQRGSGGGGGGGGGVTGDAGDGAAGGAAPTDSTGDTGRGGQRRQRRRARARVDASAAQRGRGPVACGAVARARRRRTAQPATRCRSATGPCADRVGGERGRGARVLARRGGRGVSLTPISGACTV